MIFLQCNVFCTLGILPCLMAGSLRYRIRGCFCCSWLAVLLSLLAPAVCYTQVLTPLQRDLGLSQNFVTSIAQDGDGFLWFGTKNGLNRFDGYGFEVFQHDPADSNSVSSGYIQSLLVDSEGRLWVGTDAGLDRYNPNRSCFDHIRNTKERTDDLTLGAIQNLAEGPQGRIYAFGERHVLYVLEDSGPGEGYRIRSHPHPNHNQRPYPDMVVDAGGMVWINSTEFLYRFDPSPEKSESNWTRVNWDWFSPSWRNAVTKPEPNLVYLGTQDTLFYLLFPASDGGIWLATSPGFVHIDAQGELSYHSIDIERPDGRGIMHYFGGGDAFERNGRLWIGGFEAFATYNLDDASFDRLDLVETDRRWTESLTHGEVLDLQNTGILSLYEDVSGLLWIGTNGYGIWTLDQRGPLFDRPPANRRVVRGSVRTLLLSQEGRVWSYDYTNLLTVTDLQSGRTSPVHINEEAPGFVNNHQAFSIRGMAWDALGRLWMASEGGLAVAETQGETLANFRAYPIRFGSDYWGTKQAGAYHMQQDADGHMWFVTSSSLGRLDTANGQYQEWPFPVGRDGATDHSEYPDLVQGDDGICWIGTKEGLLAFNPATGQYTTYRNNPADASSLSYDVVKCIRPDPAQPERYIWVGTGGGGLNRLDRSTGHFDRWTVADGLPDPVVYGILFDRQQRLWLSSNQGLASFEPESGIWRQFDLEDGLQDLEFNTRAFAKGEDGRLLFGGIRGFNIFQPATIVLDTFSPRIGFSELLLANQRVDLADALRRMDAPIQTATRLELGPKDKVLTLGVVSMDFRSPKTNRFAYKLDGFDAEWQDIGTQHSITFTNLDPGRYTLRVRGTNADGHWSVHEAALAIRVRPPWFGTWWAWCLWVGAAVVVLMLLYQGQLQRRLQAAETERLADLDRFKSRFFTNITHEFRTPLTVILGLSERIEGPDGTRERIQRNGRQLLHLINQLLDLSRLEAGVVQVQWEQGRWDHFLEYLTESFQSMAVSKGIRLAHYAETRPIEGHMDREKLQHIVSNLIDNALKYTPEEGRVTVHSKRVEGPDGPQLRLKVSDNGPGMSPVAASHVFERFYRDQEHSETTGTGIGLALTKELVDALGGQIMVESRQGNGSVFEVILPLTAPPGQMVREASPEAERRDAHAKEVERLGANAKVAERPDAKEVERLDANAKVWNQPKPVQEDAPAGNGLVPDDLVPDAESQAELDRPCVLVVEDNPDVIAFIADLLSGRFTVLQARDGQSGIALAREHVPDAVLSDVMMPVMDGYQLTRELKQDRRTSHIPVVLLTARASQEDKLLGLKAGADAYLQKPFDPEELFVRMEHLLALRKVFQDASRSAWTANTSPDRGGEAAVVAPDEGQVPETDTNGLSPDGNHSPGNDRPTPLERERQAQEAAFLAEARKAVLEHLAEDAFGPNELAEALDLNPTQAYRKIRALTDRNPTLFIRAVRLREAKRLLESTELSISEIAYAVGFNQPAYFTRAFKAEFGEAPSAARN